MNAQPVIQSNERYCTVKESIVESFKEIKLMREGKEKKNTLDDLWSNIKKWSKDG